VTARANVDLAGQVVLVANADTPSGAELARSITAAGGAVVLVGGDPGALGRLAASLLADGARCAIFVGDPRDDAERSALAELVAELF
jgi:inactivated superfamily I helicase